MLNRDYFLRYVEEFSKAIAHLAGLREQGKHKEGLEYLEQQWTSYNGLTPEAVDGIDAEDLISQLVDVLKQEDPQIECLGLLLHESSECLQALDDQTLAKARALKALTIFQYLHEKPGADYSFERLSRISALQRYLQA